MAVIIDIEITLVLVIAWVAVKFGINTMSVVLEMGINFTRRIPMLFPVNTILTAYTHAVH